MELEKAFRTLKVTKETNLEEVKNSYRELAKKYHPDLYKNNPLAYLAEEKLKEVNEAYEMLKDYFENKEKYAFEEENYNSQYEDIKTEKYQKHYSNSSFWDKVKKIAKKAGLKVICYALTLYYVLQKDDVPVAEKGLIIRALGYFILPIDLIPDVMIGLGYTDDAAAMFIAIQKCLQYVDEDIKNQVYLKLSEWFDDVEYEEVEKILKV